MDAKPAEYFYRVDLQSSEACSLQYVCTQHRVIKKTPKGAWVEQEGYNARYNPKQKKFILDAAIKKWANPTIEEAINAFKHRKIRQIRILSNRLQEAKKAVAYLPGVKSDNFKFDDYCFAFLEVDCRDLSLLDASLLDVDSE